MTSDLGQYFGAYVIKDAEEMRRNKRRQTFKNEIKE
jgi:hypothetical protein